MANLEDDSEFDYLPQSEGVGFLSAGWISADHGYTEGEVSEEFFLRLCQLLDNRWSPPVASAGIHRCELCRFSGGATTYNFGSYKFSAVGSGELFVPTSSGVYVAPVSIAHTIDCHRYRPSDGFIDAVMNCPEMRSVQYLKNLLDGGVREWTNRMEAEFNQHAEQAVPSKSDRAGG